MTQTPGVRMAVTHPSQVAAARGQAETLALALGFDDQAAAEIALSVSELASNLVKYAPGGELVISGLSESGRRGLQVETLDQGPGIKDVETACADGFSSAGSLGYGLGTVNRLMDELEISSNFRAPAGTRVVCRRWLRKEAPDGPASPFEVGAAARPHPKMTVNGDAFVIKSGEGSTLVAVIDGLGHGQFAHRASQKAAEYVERHFN
ncbi:MAG: anti-sigma regulatory factor, partial [Proteobacteria bacterium]|nr:anti-sigma regulatory factor [Pseudomonadota bacterium]